MKCIKPSSRLIYSFRNKIGRVRQVVINELDPSGLGLDDQEFIELFGSPGEDLSGYVVVIYNGSNGLSNLTFDLSGMAMNDEGFFLIGGPALTQADYVHPGTNWLQVGQEGVALYDADAASFPDGTPVTSEE